MRRYRITFEGGADLDAPAFYGQEEPETTFEAFQTALDNESLRSLLNDWNLEDSVEVNVEDVKDGHRATLRGGWSWDFHDNTAELERARLKAETEGCDPLFPELPELLP